MEVKPIRRVSPDQLNGRDRQKSAPVPNPDHVYVFDMKTGSACPDGPSVAPGFKGGRHSATPGPQEIHIAAAIRDACGCCSRALWVACIARY